MSPLYPVFKFAEVLEHSGATRSQLEYWMRLGIIVPLKDARSSGDHRQFSLQNVIEAGLARELTSHGLSVQQVQIVFTKLRAQVNKLRPALRASAVFVRYVEMVDAIVIINGPGPNYAQWRKDVTAFMRTWQQKEMPLDDRILHLLAAKPVSKGQRDAQR